MCVCENVCACECVCVCVCVCVPTALHHCNTMRNAAAQGFVEERILVAANDNLIPGTLQHTATHCNTPRHTATRCNTLQHTATRCIILQHRVCAGGHVVARYFGGNERQSDSWARHALFTTWVVSSLFCITAASRTQDCPRTFGSLFCQVSLCIGWGLSLVSCHTRPTDSRLPSHVWQPIWQRASCGRALLWK